MVREDAEKRLACEHRAKRSQYGHAAVNWTDDELGVA